MKAKSFSRSCWSLRRLSVLIVACWLLQDQEGSAQSKRGIKIFSDIELDRAKQLYLDDQLQWVSSPEEAEVLLVGLPSRNWELLRRWQSKLNQGAILLLFPDPSTSSLEFGDFILRIGPQVTGSIPIKFVGGLDHRWSQQINWGSAPSITNYYSIQLEGAQSEELLSTSSSGDQLISRVRSGRGAIFLFSFSFPTPSNKELANWPYFRYLLYAITQEARNLPVEDFSSWKHSPLPGVRSQVVFLSGLVVLGLLTLFFFRQSRASPSPSPLSFQTPTTHVTSGPWQRPGFERPLAGFLSLLSITILMLIPTFYYSNVFFTNRVVPSPQALGMDRWVFWFFSFFWLFFDLGTAEAMVKFFAQYFSTDRARAFRYVNFFVWWQILTGLIQLSSVVIAAVYLVPHTQYAYLSFLFIFHALRQYPGLFYVKEDQQPLTPQSFFNLFFRALQRFDLEQRLRLYTIFVMVGCQVSGILLARQWGIAHPQYGEVLAMSAGISLSSFVAYGICFGVGAWLYKRAGFRLSVVLAANFDRQIAWESLSLGTRFVAGKIAFQFGELVQTLIISTLLMRYTEMLGVWFFMLNFASLYHVGRSYFDSLVPVVAEAVGMGRRKLLEYVINSGLRYGTLYGLTIGAILGTASRPFILHFSAPQWHAAAQFLPIFCLWGYLIHSSAIAENILLGAGRPGLCSITSLLEQGFRISLMVFLIPRFQFWGIILSYLFPIIAKNILGWWMIWTKVIRFRFYGWPILVTPTLAALTNGLLILALGSWYWRLSSPWVEILFCLNILMTFPTAFFFNGLFGGWDHAGLAELKQACSMSGVMTQVSRVFPFCANAGVWLSPLRARFSIPTQSEEERELLSLPLQQNMAAE